MAVVLRCKQCAVERRWTEQQMLDRLQARGMLRRESDPAPEMLLELFKNVVADVPCQDCGGLGAAVLDDWDDDWEDVVKCKGCNDVIPPERLEVFPDTKFCPKCQVSNEAGQDPGEDCDYCPRCGAVMSLSRKGGTGIARYQMSCGDCGYRG